MGCVELLNTVQRRVRPKLHVFGGIHEGKARRRSSWLVVSLSVISLHDGDLSCTSNNLEQWFSNSFSFFFFKPVEPVHQIKC